MVRPSIHKNGSRLDQQALYAADIGEEVEHSVAITRNDKLVQIHFERDVHLRVIVPLEGLRLQFVHFEYACVFELSDVV